MKLGSVEDFLPAGEVEAKLAQVDASALDGEDRRAVDTLLRRFS